MTTVGLLTLALLVPAAPQGRLQRGDELTYTGSVIEVIERPGNRFRREHELEVRVFVLERRDRWADAAVLTLLRRVAEGPVAEALPEITGKKRMAPFPPAARLDFVRIHNDGTVHRLSPSGPAPLRFAPDTTARLLPVPPLDSFAPFEFGMFPPPQKGKENAWSVPSADPVRAPERWSVRGRDFINFERCTELMMEQQSADWERPIGGLTSWQRVDRVWVSEHGLARRVHRLIRQRDGIATEPAVRIEVKYDLQEQGRPIGQTYDRYRADIETAYLAASEMAPLIKDAARLGPEPFEQRIAKLDARLAAASATPYREAVLAVRRQLEAARKGEAIAEAANGETAIVPVVKVAAIGEAAPPFASGSFDLSKQRGTPVVLVFFKPGRATAERSLRIADALQKKFGSRIAVAAFVVSGSLESGIADRDRLKLAVPVYDGSPAAAVYGVDSFPRFYAIDGRGKLRWSFAGVGGETGFLLREQVETLLASPAATGSPDGTANRRRSPRP